MARRSSRQRSGDRRGFGVWCLSGGAGLLTEHHCCGVGAVMFRRRVVKSGAEWSIAGRIRARARDGRPAESQAPAPMATNSASPWCDLDGSCTGSQLRPLLSAATTSTGRSLPSRSSNGTLDRVDKAVGKGPSQKVTKAIDKGDYDAVVKAVNEGDEKIIEAAAT